MTPVELLTNKSNLLFPPESDSSNLKYGSVARISTCFPGLTVPIPTSPSDLMLTLGFLVPAPTQKLIPS